MSLEGLLVFGNYFNDFSFAVCATNIVNDNIDCLVMAAQTGEDEARGPRRPWSSRGRLDRSILASYETSLKLMTVYELYRRIFSKVPAG